MTQTVYINCYDAGDNFPTVDSSTVSDNTNRTWNNIHQWETGSKGLDKPDGIDGLNRIRILTDL